MEKISDREILNKLSMFLSTKGKITKIINPNIRIPIMLSQAGVATAIILGMIGVGIFGLASYGAYMKIFVEHDKFISVYTHIRIFVMFVILAITVVVAAIHCKRQSMLDIRFAGDTTILVNNTAFNIKENDCYIDIWEAPKYLGRGTGAPPTTLEWKLMISKNGCRKRYNLYLPEEYMKVVHRGFAREEYFNNLNRRTDIEELVKLILNFEYENKILEEKTKRRNFLVDFNEVYEMYNKYRR